MPEKIRFWKKIQQSRKKQVVFFLLIMVGLFAIYLPSITKIKEIREKENLGKQKVVTDYDILTNVENAKIEDGKIQLSGWAFRLNSKNSNIRVVLQAVDNSETKVFHTSMKEDRAVVERFVSDLDVGACRFLVEEDAKVLREDICYEIFIALDYIEEAENEETRELSRKVATGKYLYQGELYLYNPENYTEPQVTDEELLQVITEGTLRAYDLEMQMWVYQYGLQLYYIVNPSFGSMELNQIGIPVISHTSKTELLPEHRIQYGSVHLGFYYENREYEREGVFPYQVVKVTLSDKYPITYIATGFYKNTEEKWIKRIRIGIMD